MVSLKHIIELWREKFSTVQKDYNNHSIPWSIIKNNMTLKEYKKRYKCFNMSFKYKFFLPLLWFANRILKRIMITPDKVEVEVKNKMLLAWNENFDYSIREWCMVYRKDAAYDAENSYRNDKAVEALRTMNNILVTGYVHDTAYRVFFDMLLMNWAIKFGELYPDKIEGFHYNSKAIDDIEFKMIIGKTKEHIVLDLNGNTIAVKKGDAILIGDVVQLKKDLGLIDDNGKAV